MAFYAHMNRNVPYQDSLLSIKQYLVAERAHLNYSPTNTFSEKWNDILKLPGFRDISELSLL